MKPSRRTVALAGAALTASALVLSACSGSPASAPAATDSTGALEVMSWWTSGSENSALQVLNDAVKAKNPAITITDGAVAGGAGANVQVALASRLRAGNPPDVWQTFAGAPTKAYANAGQTADVSSVYGKSGLATALAPTILDSLTIDGKQYGVPTGAHRTNVLWFSTKALTKAGITAPTGQYSFDAFIADLDKAGVKVAVKKGTTGHLYATANLKNAAILVLDKESAAVLEVSQGKADAFIYDQMSTYQNWQRNKATTRAILEPFQKESWAVGIAKGNDELKGKVNAFIKDYRAKGGFEQLGDRYLKEMKDEFKRLGYPFFL